MRILLCLWIMLWASALRAAPLFFVEAEVDQPAPRVQAEVLLTLKFFQGGDVRDLKFLAPPQRLADIEPTDKSAVKPDVTEVVRDGLRYRRHLQTFRVRPFASGALELSGLGVEGRRPGAKAREQWLVPALHLNVRPAPNGIEHWLPARQLSLRELPVEQATPAVGQPWLRTVVIEAEGSEASTVPEVAMVIEGATVIARAPRTDTLLSGKRHVLVREQTFEIVPQRAGSLRLPPLVMGWWDVTGDVLAVSRLPARELVVQGALPPPVETPAFPYWQLWLGVMLGAMLGMMVVLVLLYRSRLWWRAQFALRSGQPETIRRALLDWGRAHWPDDPPLSLLDLARRLGKDGEELTALDRLCYGAGGVLPRLAWRMLWISRQAE